MPDTKKSIQIKVNSDFINGDLVIPEKPVSLVIFAHGSGSSRFSPRNRFVATKLRRAHMATLLFDLLTDEEDKIYQNRFDIDLLTERLIKTTKLVEIEEEVKGLPIGYFGASTGVAAALKAAARLGTKIKAIVSRGGRPDMAEPDLEEVRSPTLFIVGGNDYPIVELNKVAMERLNCVKRLEIVSGAGHLFEEPGSLEQVANLALDWFKKYLL